VIGSTCTFGFSASNAVEILSNAWLSDAAANTVSSPLAVEDAAVGVGVAAGAAPEHAVRASAAARAVAAIADRRNGRGDRVIATRSFRSR
jgi:hypothetical protein